MPVFAIASPLRTTTHSRDPQVYPVLLAHEEGPDFAPSSHHDRQLLSRRVREAMAATHIHGAKRASLLDQIDFSQWSSGNDAFRELLPYAPLPRQLVYDGVTSCPLGEHPWFPASFHEMLQKSFTNLALTRAAPSKVDEVNPLRYGVPPCFLGTADWLVTAQQAIQTAFHHGKASTERSEEPSSSPPATPSFITGRQHLTAAADGIRQVLLSRKERRSRGGSAVDFSGTEEEEAESEDSLSPTMIQQRLAVCLQGVTNWHREFEACLSAGRSPPIPPGRRGGGEWFRNHKSPS